MTTSGTKFDQGKPRLDLIDSTFLEELGKVLGFGAQKYAAHNWRNGLALSRLQGAAMRHMVRFNDGESVDPETGLSHLAHAACNVMFALWTLKNRPELDDRYKVGAEVDTDSGQAKALSAPLKQPAQELLNLETYLQKLLEFKLDGEHTVAYILGRQNAPYLQGHTNAYKALTNTLQSIISLNGLQARLYDFLEIPNGGDKPQRTQLLLSCVEALAVYEQQAGLEAVWLPEFTRLQGVFKNT